MRILLINNFHYLKGGSEAVYFNTARLLRENGHTVVCFSQKDNLNEHCPEEDYFFDGNGGTLSSFIKYFYNRDAAVQLERLLDTFTPDIAHIHLMWGCSASSVLKVLNRHNIPIVHTAHDYRMVCPAYVFKTPDGTICERCNGNTYLPCLLNRCSKSSLVQSAMMTFEMYLRRCFYDPIKTIDGFVFVSHFSEQKHIQHDPRFASAQKIVVYNCTPQKQIVPVSKGDYFLYFGRLSKEKGISTLIEAFSQRPDLKLKIVGTGPLDAEIKKTAPDNVQICGYMSGNKLFSVIKSARFVIVPSEWYENNPMTIVESYSVGVPVIGANIGGIPEIVSDGKTGFLFNSFDITSLVRTIDKVNNLSAGEIDTLSKNAFDFYQKHFSEDIHITKIVEFYESVCMKVREQKLNIWGGNPVCFIKKRQK